MNADAIPALRRICAAAAIDVDPLHGPRIHAYREAIHRGVHAFNRQLGGCATHVGGESDVRTALARCHRIP